jgi:hypothetical protein
MAVKLASISKQIHWSSLIRAAVFAASWWYLPTWLFLVLSCGIYFLPPFETRRNLPAFIVLIALSLATPSTVFMAVIYGVLCYYLLLIKDFLVVDRKSARAMLAMALSFFLFREFFFVWQAGFSPGSLAWAWIVAIAFGMLMNGVIVARRGKEVSEEREAVHLRHIAVSVSALTLFEVLAVCLFLPVDFIYQSIAAFLAAAILLDFVPAYFFRDLEPRRICATAMALAALLVVVLASAKWGI